MVCDKEVLFGVSSMKKIFQGNIPPAEFLKGILHANRHSQITFERREIDGKFRSQSVRNLGHGIDW
jgi:hypothetical protein